MEVHGCFNCVNAITYFKGSLYNSILTFQVFWILTKGGVGSIGMPLNFT